MTGHPPDPGLGPLWCALVCFAMLVLGWLVKEWIRKRDQ